MHTKKVKVIKPKKKEGRIRFHSLISIYGEFSREIVKSAGLILDIQGDAAAEILSALKQAVV